MKIALLVMTDGRKQYIHKTLASAFSELDGPIVHRVMFDDSADEANHQWLRDNFPNFDLYYKPTRQGFGGAINSAWHILRNYDFDYVFHLEDDFTFNRPVILKDMAKKLEENPNVFQMALRRQPWNNEERAAGGVIQRWPDQFHQQDGFISHRLFFTTNPSLYRKSLIDSRDYATVKDAEGHFTLSITAESPEYCFGFWGDKSDQPWVTHIGAERGRGTY